MAVGLLLWWAGRSLAPRVLSIVAHIQSFGAAAPLAFIVIYALAVVALIPASLLTIAGGAVFGLLPGVALRADWRDARLDGRVPARPLHRPAVRGETAGGDAALRRDRAGGQRARPAHRVPAAAVAGGAVQFPELRARADDDLGVGFRVRLARDHSRVPSSTPTRER